MFRVGSFRWGVGGLCIAIGAMMLVTPHQFASPIYAALQPQLPIWGIGFFSLGLGLVALAVLRAPRWVQALLHVGAGLGFLILAYGVATTGGWTGTSNFGMVGLIAVLSPLLMQRHSKPGDPGERDLLSLAIGSGAILTGLSILLLPGQFANPTYNIIRSALPIFGIVFLAGGAALVYVQVHPSPPSLLVRMAHLTTGAALLAFCVASSIPLRAWIGIAYYGGMGALTLLLPWLDPRLRRFDTTSLRARLALTLAGVLVVSDVAVIALLDDVIIARLGPAWTGSINEVRELSFAVLIVSVVVAAAAGVAIASWLASPLRALTRASERLAAEDLTAPLPTSDVREVLDLASTFGYMRERLASREQSLRESAAAVERNREQLEAVFQAVQDGVVVSDMDGNFLLVNDAEAAINGYGSAEEMRLDLAYFSRVYELRYPDGTLVPVEDWPLSRVLRGESIDECELIGRRSDTGQEWFFSFSGEPVRDEAGRQYLAVVITRDVTARKRAEQDREQLLASEQEARKEAEALVKIRDEFISVAAHELKTPVTSLQGFAQILLRQYEKSGGYDPARLAKGMETIVQQARRLTRLTEQLLNLSRLQAGRLVLERETVDLSAAVRAIVSSMQHSYPDRTIEIRDDKEIHVLVDPVRFEQVVVNLVDNALKFSPHDSQVEVEVALERPGWAYIAVRDRGIGIPEEKRGRVFERFYQAHPERHYGGMGIGLFLTRQIVEMHGGTVAYEPTEDGGSRFVVRIPTDPQYPSSDSGR